MKKRTFGVIEYQHQFDSWVIVTCEPHISIRLKKIFPKIGITQTPPYRFGNSPEICMDLDWFMQRYPLNIGKKDKQLLNRQKNSFLKEQKEVEEIFLPDWTPPAINLETKPGFKYRDYQMKGIHFIKKVKRTLIGDDIGLGKTYVGIGTCMLPKALPAIVVVETHLQQQWIDKIEEFSYLKAYAVKKATPYKLPTADIYIMRYSQLAGWVNLFDQGFFKAVLFDEIQALRTGTASKKGSAAMVLSRNVEYCVGLTATPVYNFGIEAFNLMEVINAGNLGTKTEFTREWCADNEKVVRDPKALGSYLRENHLMIRRTRKEVEKELRPVNTIIEHVGYNESAVIKIEEMAKKLAIKTLTGSFVERGQAARDLDIALRQATGISKANHVAQYVRMIVESGQPVVLAGWHRAVYETWLEKLSDLKPAMYTGSETPRKKHKSAQSFINGETDILIISLRSGAGLDGLQSRASIIVHGELDWSPQVHQQLTGRVDRDGQLSTEPVMSIFLISEFGSDPAMVDLLGLKSSQAKGIVDPTAPLERINNSTERISKLAKSFLKQKGIKIEELPEKAGEPHNSSMSNSNP